MQINMRLLSFQYDFWNVLYLSVNNAISSQVLAWSKLYSVTIIKTESDISGQNYDHVNLYIRNIIINQTN